MKISNLTLQNNLFLAPMAGVTDRAYREITQPFGVGLMYTEMVSAKGLYYNDSKTSDLLQTSEVERPIGVQIFGSEPEIMGQIMDKALRFGGELIDINMGCPAPKIVNNGDGSALMKNPKLAADIVRAVKTTSPVPVTVKIRAGWDAGSINAVEFAKYLEDAGADAITVHGRTREQFYSGFADLSVIADVVRAVGVPIIGNGDVKSLADAENMVAQTGCSGVMIGRGAMGNPWIFSGEIPTLEERLSTARRHIALMVQYKGEYRAIKEARKVLGWYFAGIHGATKLRREVNTVETLDDVEKLLEKVSQNT
ncbi:MAG: tRNA dihydrouridine synthase DusB [Oscillospiraceae bacterium]|nr:tRNA dihydrouridine synthase DusB [Oscillospiraceae bacterium]